MKDLIIPIVRAPVDHPEQIEISEIISEPVMILELKVVKADMGKIIGKNRGGVKFQRIQCVAFYDEFPRNVPGKTLKREMREAYEKQWQTTMGLTGDPHERPRQRQPSPPGTD